MMDVLSTSFAETVTNPLPQRLEYFKFRLTQKFGRIDERLFVEGEGGIQFTSSKDEERARKYQGISLKHKDKSNLISAMEYINKCICHAKPGSSFLSLAYIARAEILLEYLDYRAINACIRLAKEKGLVNAEVRMKLDELESSVAIKRVEHNAENSPLPSRSLPSRRKYPAKAQVKNGGYRNRPFLSKEIEVVVDAHKNYHVVSKRDLEVGDIISVEEPYALVLPMGLTYQRCHHCGNERSMNLLPCSDCTNVMFCADCYDVAIKKYHQYECKVIRYMYNELANEHRRLALRATVIAITNLNKVEYIVDPPPGCTLLTVEDTFLIYSQNPSREMARSEIIFAQRKNVNWNIQKHQALASVLYALMAKSDLNKYLSDDGLYLTTILEHMIFVTDYKLCKSIDMADKKLDDANRRPCFMLPLRSMLNHSCVPNVTTTIHDNRVILSVIRPISSGKEIVDSHGVHYLDSSISFRHEHLHCKCPCMACKNFWPSYRRPRRNVSYTLEGVNDFTVDQLLGMHRRKLFNEFMPAVCRYMQTRTYDDQPPSDKLLEVQSLYQHLMELRFGSNIALKHRKKLSQEDTSDRLVMHMRSLGYDDITTSESTDSPSHTYYYPKHLRKASSDMDVDEDLSNDDDDESME